MNCFKNVSLVSHISKGENFYVYICLFYDHGVIQGDSKVHNLLSL